MRSTIHGQARRPGASMRGITLIELLVASTVLVVLLVALGAFLAQQTQVRRALAARSELQDKVRTVTQIVARDLQLAGSSVYVRADGTLGDPPNAPGTCSNFTNLLNEEGNPLDDTESCLVVADGGGAGRDFLLVVYVSSLFDELDACRAVGYRMNGTTLERADVSCTDNGLDHVDPTNDSLFVPFATNILAFDVAVVCSNDPEGSQPMLTFPDEAVCLLGPTYARSALVRIFGRSDNRAPGGGEASFDLAGGTTVDCDGGFVCFGTTEEVILLNLKER